MKLRNKHTGEVKEFNEIFLTKTVKETNTATSEYVERSYCSIDELNADWEDYKPKEPLIKDELARKAIRAWAEANSLRCDDKVEARTPTVDCCVLGLTHGFTSIDVIVNEETSLKDYSRYTIAELCGEEEE